MFANETLFLEDCSVKAETTVTVTDEVDSGSTSRDDCGCEVVARLVSNLEQFAVAFLSAVNLKQLFFSPSSNDSKTFSEKRQRKQRFTVWAIIDIISIF